MDIDNKVEEIQGEQPADQETQQVEPIESDSAVSETEVQPEEKKGAAQRIKELNQQVKTLSERVSELTQQPENITPYVPDVKPGEEISPERYQSDITKTADSIVNLRMRQYDAETRIKAESAEVQKIYPQLDKNSAEFDEELSDTITEAVEAHIRVNPYNAQVRKFVDKLMKPYRQSVEREIGKERENIAKQVSQSAIRPTQVKSREKTASEMSLAELEAKLGVVNS